MSNDGEIFRRFKENPLLRPRDVSPSRGDFVVECLLNPGAFEYRGRIGLLLRVAERPAQEEGWLSVPIINADREGGIEILRVRTDDPEVEYNDPRVFRYRGKAYLTTLSHLRLAWSDDGVSFTADAAPTLIGVGGLETFGIEDVRVTEIDGAYYLTYTAVSPFGHGVNLITTRDWKIFDRHGMILPPANKDCALFSQRINGQYWAIHRPSTRGLGGNFIWTASSPDALHWGNHQCIVTTRPGSWDSARVGAGASPIKTHRGWLEIYHGADPQPRYALGLLIMDLNNPARVLARSISPVMTPREPYELTGFFGNVVFTNGHVVRPNGEILMYYGASDEVVCGATATVDELLATLPPET
jgi:beta-1,2-mannobiose phosphorylase / 1,2-beta-oligomannan phosphorylase